MESHPNSEANELLSPNWLKLPRDVTVSILEKLDALDILENVKMVCTQWESICKDPFLWRTIVYRWEFTYTINYTIKLLDSIYKQAVNLSCGGLIDLSIIDVGTDEFLDYVTQRCTQIRRLRLVWCCVTDDGLCEVAKRLPLLEDLEISYCYNVTTKALHKFGECCPLIKSLKVNNQGTRYPLMDDQHAEVIAETMVELRHLQLFGNQLTHNGLKAILDSCSHLESLDLRQCFNINLNNSSLGKICAERVKYLRAPCDSTDDYEFDATLYEDMYE